MVRPGSDLWRLEELAGEGRCFLADLRDADAVRRAVRDARPDVVFHLAAHGGYPFQRDARRILETNVLGTYNLLRACEDSPCRLLVHAGSSSEYGAKSAPMKEDDRLEPNSYYAVGKAAATHLCSYEAGRVSFAVATLRLFSVYGPYEEPSRLIPTVIRKALRGEPLELVPPETPRDFVYIDDVLDAFLCLDRLASCRGDVINIASGIQSTVRDVVNEVLELTQSRSEVRWSALAPREWDVACWVGSPARASKLLGWHARHSLRDGLRKTVEWFRYRFPEGA